MSTFDSQQGGPGSRGRARVLVRARSRQPHHRRRRLIATGVLASVIVILVITIVVGQSLPAHHRARARAAPHPAAVRQTPAERRAAEAARETAAIDRTLAFTPYVRIAGAQHREVAFTFDDGPGPFTAGVVRALVRGHAAGTFFEVGVEEGYFHAGTQAVLRHHFAIGDHTQSHAPMSKLSRRDQRDQLLQDTSSIGNWGASFPRLFRPPYGLWNKTTLRLLHRYRMLMVLWTVDTNDYRQPGVAAIVHAAVSGARPGAIILLHDAGGDRAETVAALPKIIRALRRRGYKFVTVPRLLADNPAPPKQDISALAGAGG